MKTTLRDVAKETGFSVNTVSHALKNKSDISEATTKIIKEAADRLGYIGNASASYLRSGISRTVAIILGDISNPHFAILVKEIELYIKDLGYTTFILNTEEDEECEKRAILSALNKNVDGIIICPSQQSSDNIEFLKRADVPFTLIGRRFSDVETNYVVCDDVNGGYIATKHLLEQGHNKILFLNGSPYISSSVERLEGYKKALEEFNIPFNDEDVRNVSIKMGQGELEILQILESSSKYTAILAFSDMLAWEIIYLLQKLGLSTPNDRSVVGFDNIQSKFLFPVSLTTVSSSKSTMAQTAAKLLVDTIEKVNVDIQKIVLSTELVIRDSTKSVK